MSKLSENCPICGAKMEKGYLEPGSAALFWSKKKQRHTGGAEVIAGKRIRVRGMTGFKAYRCLNCKIVFFPYGEEKEEPIEK